MKAKIWINSLIGAILSLLGFGSFGCGMYACPYGDLTVDGAVLDENGKPLPHIQVVRRSGWRDDAGTQYWEPYADTLYTSDEGQFHRYVQGDFPHEYHMLIANDTNSTYQSDSVMVKVEYKGGHSWYRGKAYITNVFLLKKK